MVERKGKCFLDRSQPPCRRNLRRAGELVHGHDGAAGETPGTVEPVLARAAGESRGGAASSGEGVDLVGDLDGTVDVAIVGAVHGGPDVVAGDVAVGLDEAPGVGVGVPADEGGVGGLEGCDSVEAGGVGDVGDVADAVDGEVTEGGSAGVDDAAVVGRARVDVDLEPLGVGGGGEDKVAAEVGDVTSAEVGQGGGQVGDDGGGTVGGDTDEAASLHAEGDGVEVVVHDVVTQGVQLGTGPNAVTDAVDITSQEIHLAKLPVVDVETVGLAGKSRARGVAVDIGKRHNAS